MMFTCQYPTDICQPKKHHDLTHCEGNKRAVQNQTQQLLKQHFTKDENVLPPTLEEAIMEKVAYTNRPGFDNDLYSIVYENLDDMDENLLNLVTVHALQTGDITAALPVLDIIDANDRDNLVDMVVEYDSLNPTIKKMCRQDREKQQKTGYPEIEELNAKAVEILTNTAYHTSDNVTLDRLQQKVLEIGTPAQILNFACEAARHDCETIQNHFVETNDTENLYWLAIDMPEVDLPIIEQTILDNGTPEELARWIGAEEAILKRRGTHYSINKEPFIQKVLETNDPAAYINAAKQLKLENQRISERFQEATQTHGTPEDVLIFTEQVQQADKQSAYDHLSTRSIEHTMRLADQYNTPETIKNQAGTLLHTTGTVDDKLTWSEHLNEPRKESLVNEVIASYNPENLSRAAYIATNEQSVRILDTLNELENPTEREQFQTDVVHNTKITPEFLEAIARTGNINLAHAASQKLAKQ